VVQQEVPTAARRDAGSDGNKHLARGDGEQDRCWHPQAAALAHVSMIHLIALARMVSGH